MGLGLTFLLSLSSLSLFLGPSLSDFQVLCIERKALSLDSSISMTMLKSEQVGMQRDWLKTNFMPLIRSRSSWPCSSTTTTFFFFFYLLFCLFFQLSIDLGWYDGSRSMVRPPVYPYLNVQYGWLRCFCQLVCYTPWALFFFPFDLWFL